MLVAQRVAVGICLALFAFGAIAAALALLALARNCCAYDPMMPVIVGSRLPGVTHLGQLFMAALGAWFIGFIGILYSVARAGISTSRPTLIWTLGLQLALCAAFAALPISIDADQYGYVGYAYAQANGNAYSPTPLSSDAPKSLREVVDRLRDPLVGFRYGPLWTLFNAAVLYPVIHRPLSVQTGVLRIVAIIASAILTLLLGATLGRGRPLAIVAAFSLNPLVTVEVANGAHNDIYVALCGVLVVWLLLRWHFASAGVALGAGAAMKFVYLPLVVPLAAGIFVTRRRGTDVLLAACGFFATLLFSAAPFGIRRALFDVPLASMKLNPGGPLALAARLMKAHAPFASDASFVLLFVLLRDALAVIAVLAIAAFALSLLRGRFNAATAVVTALSLFLLTGKVEPWYAIMFVPLLLASRAGFYAFIGMTAGSAALISAEFTRVFPVLAAIVIAILASILAVATITLPQRGAAFQSDGSISG